jgi:hypothetical protein
MSTLQAASCCTLHPSTRPSRRSQRRHVVVAAAAEPAGSLPQAAAPAAAAGAVGRRDAGLLLGSMLLAPWLASSPASAAALTLEYVTPAVAPAQPLSARWASRRRSLQLLACFRCSPLPHLHASAPALPHHQSNAAPPSETAGSRQWPTFMSEWLPQSPTSLTLL